MASAQATGSVAEFASRLIANVETVIVGKRAQIEMVLLAMLCEGHVLIEDVPGTGKTMLARALTASMGLSFKRIQCTPDLLPNDITGVSIYDQGSSEFEFQPGPIFVNFMLADEINRATPRTQAALLEAMAEGQVTADGVTRPLPQPFVVVATQNPVEFEGTFPLPAAQLDRFLLKLSLGYTTEDDELQMLHNLRGRNPIDTIAQVVDGGLLPGLHSLVGSVFVEESLERYILRLARATREHPDVAVGASPRGSLALYKTAQALAVLRGRDFVVPDDAKALAPLTLPHRLILRPESLLRGQTAEKIVADIVERTPLDLDRGWQRHA